MSTSPAQRLFTNPDNVWRELIRESFAAKPIDDFSKAHINNPDSNVWDAFKISMHSGFTVEVNESIYWYYLEVLPPIFQIGNHFGFAEGHEYVVHFWSVGSSYFCRRSDILNPCR